MLYYIPLVTIRSRVVVVVASSLLLEEKGKKELKEKKEWVDRDSNHELVGKTKVTTSRRR